MSSSEVETGEGHDGDGGKKHTEEGKRWSWCCKGPAAPKWCTCFMDPISRLLKVISLRITSWEEGKNRRQPGCSRVRIKRGEESEGPGRGKERERRGRKEREVQEGKHQVCGGEKQVACTELGGMGLWKSHRALLSNYLRVAMQRRI